MRKITATVGAVVIVAGLLSVGPTFNAAHAAGSSSAVTTTSTLHWGRCPDPGLDGSLVTCAVLTVPMDYQDPNGPTISLELSRRRHTSAAKNYKGVILTNPGGPGASGLELPGYLPNLLPGGVGRDFDWVSWDPRGVGYSRPALHCDGSYFGGPRPSYVPTTKRLLDYWLSRSKKYAETCEQKYPDLLNNMTTIDSARDMNSIRVALGVSAISYYGLSYGTYLGQVYSTMYPHHLKRMVLDSTVNPHAIWYRANLGQDSALDRNLQSFFAWVGRHDSDYELGATRTAVSARYYRDLAALNGHPRGRLGPAEWTDAFTGAGYSNSLWPELADAWAAADLHGQPGFITDAYVENDGPGNDNSFAVYNAVQCTDVQWPTSWAKWRKDNDAEYRKHPFLTWSNVWYNAPCLFWGARAHRPLKINGRATKSVLMIDETHDGPTPYAGSLAVRRLYPNASLIAEPGGTNHADSLAGDACVDNQIARYLKTGYRPSRKQWNGPDALCRPLPPPGG